LIARDEPITACRNGKEEGYGHSVLDIQCDWGSREIATGGAAHEQRHRTERDRRIEAPRN
jgi:hypothetical protein